MQKGYSSQFGKPCVIVEPGDKLSAVVAFARQIHATGSFDANEEQFVVDLQINERRVGPEGYGPIGLSGCFEGGLRDMTVEEIRQSAPKRQPQTGRRRR